MIAHLRFNAGLGGVARRLFKYFSQELDRRLPRPGFRLWMLSSFGCPVAEKGKRLERHTLNEKVLFLALTGREPWRCTSNCPDRLKHCFCLRCDVR